MIMFVFFGISLIKIIFALPVAEKLSTPDVRIAGTTVVPQSMMDRLLMSRMKQSSNRLHESVQALQSAIKILFPKKEQYEEKFSADRQALLIGCMLNREKATDEQRRACKGLHEKQNQNVFYEFNDESLEEEGEQLPKRVEHINIARVRNDTVGRIQKLISTETRLINNETDGERLKLEPTSEPSFDLDVFNSSTLLGSSANDMDADGFRSDNSDERSQWLSDHSIIENTADSLPKAEAIQWAPKDSTDDQDDENDLKTMERKNFSVNAHKNPTGQNLGGTLNNLDSNNATVGVWSVSRLSNAQIPKSVLLTDLAKALRTLGTIVDRKDLDSDGDQISFKSTDLLSIIKSQKFSWKFLRFLNTIKSIIEQSNINSLN